MRRVLLGCLFSGALMAAQGDGIAIKDALLRPIVPAEEIEAGRQIDAFDADLAALRALPPAERRAKEGRLERDLKRLLEHCTGTKFENKALFLQAAWRMTYANGEGVADLLDRIDQAKFPGFQQPARALRVRLLLRQGKLEEARAIADQLVAAIPEMGALISLCEFHALIGKPAPMTVAQPMTGGPADIADRPEPFLVLHITGALDVVGLDAANRWAEELARPGYANIARLTVVTSAANPLEAVNAFRTLAGSASADLTWLAPGDTGAWSTWRNAWRFPELPMTVVLGPDRRIVAVDPQTEDVRALTGERPAPAGRTGPSTGPKGRNPSWQR